MSAEQSTDFWPSALMVLSLLALAWLAFKLVPLLEKMFTGFFITDYYRKPHELPHYVATISENEIHIERPDGSGRSIKLSDLRRVFVQTNDSGAWDYDVWFVLEGNNDAVEFPLETRGRDGVLNALKQLPGFELRGMNSTSNARFECWPNPKAEPLSS